ncbi:MAG: hypothetical protein PHG08_00785 [Bacilli bacterium]|nr:hypothetical protein [Bacilli bacterium]
MRELKVWGGTIFVYGKQVRAIVATRTKKRAMYLLGITGSKYFNNWIDTGNEIELQVALEKPETIFISYNRWSQNKDDYKKHVI